MIRKFFLSSFLLLSSSLCFSQVLRPMPPGELLLGLKKANVLASALYVAAHPDDENTAMLSWLAKDKMARTAYLSCTRGDGGQNLIGPEQAELMGLIRTHELLEARKIDGPEQYFTRANDFGFSKTTEETMQIWGKENILADVVWWVRKLRPDIIVCRFPPDARAGHGNHSSSAVLAEEAFKAAADPTRFPEQLQYVKPWQAKRVVWNTFNFGATSQKPTDPGSFIQVDIGTYNPLLGKSYPEIAAESRSQHKSQGFGSAKNRGARPEYLFHKGGDPIQKDVFDGIETSWKRVVGGKAVEKIIVQAISEFKPDNPSTIVPLLVKAYQTLSTLSDEYWVTQKKKELESLIIGASGLWFEANANDYAGAAGEKIQVKTTVVKRSDVSMTLKSQKIVPMGNLQELNASLNNNEVYTNTTDAEIPTSLPISQPYWIAEKHDKGSYKVENQLLRGLPMKPEDFRVEYTFEVAGLPLSFSIPVNYKFTDPVKGEIYRYFEVRPEVTATLADKVIVFGDNQAKTVDVLLKSHKASVKGDISLELPKGWKAEPASITFDLATKYQEHKVTFTVIPPKAGAEATLKAVAKTANGSYSKGLTTIQYDHIPSLVYFPESEAKLVRLDLQTRGKNIGYIAGAGDDVPAALQQIGYKVTMLTDDELQKDLSGFDAIVVGVRAYNTEDRLKYAQKRLMEYVQNGGNMVVQYQNNFRIVTPEIGPYPLTLSRDRVTVEEAEMTLVHPEHPALNTPNKITAKDFDGWIQERGLYFANKWAPEYTPLFACNDPNEKASEGSTLVASYGKGHYVFTALAFFRQLPAGVPGAYRLFANFISLGKK
ncbi:MAG: PIG-L family deacetylase [Spirosomataceae bacterium]